MRKKTEVKKEEGSNMSTLCEAIWKFYEYAVVIAPIILMLSHWYIFYVFSQNTQELLQYSSANEVCIAWIYTILYLYVPMMLLPASYFFGRCNLFRIPFVYFIFINVERWYYGAWFCTNEMIDTHYILIYCIMCLYAIELTLLGLKHRKDIPKLIRKSFFYFTGKVKNHFNNKEAEERYDEIMKILDDEEDG